MNDLTGNEALAALVIVKSPEILYNANSLSKTLGITAMGTLKILKKLERNEILMHRKIGRACIYQINVKNPYAIKYISFLLSSQAMSAKPLVKRWVNELKKIKNADIAVLFGSVLQKERPNDIDVLLVTDERKIAVIEEEIRQMGKMNSEKIHPIYQSLEDLVANIKKRDKAILNAIKGVVAIGEDRFIEVYDESRKE